LNHILGENPGSSTLVFSRTKHGADKIVRVLDKAKIKSAAIHGNKSQNQRQKALNDFKDGKLKVLIATDIAARGIDVEDLALVINYDLPNVPETYVHRIGRTGRASASGIALSFCNGEEKPYLIDIQKLINQSILVIDNHPFPDDGTEVFVKAPQQQRRPKTERGNSSGNRSGNGGNKAGNSGGNNNKRFGAKRN
jgi:ATP-dependent RNA helicase RhlE